MLKQFIQRSAPMHMFVQKFNEFQMDRNDQEEKEVHFTKQVCILAYVYSIILKKFHL
jgi:hypothetical protein